MKAIFSPNGAMSLDRPPVFASLLRGQPSMYMRFGFADWMLTGGQL